MQPEIYYSSWNYSVDHDIDKRSKNFQAIINMTEFFYALSHEFWTFSFPTSPNVDNLV